MCDGRRNSHARVHRHQLFVGLSFCGLTLLEQTRRGVDRLSREWRVRCEQCGREYLLSENRLIARYSDGTAGCVACNRRNTNGSPRLYEGAEVPGLIVIRRVFKGELTRLDRYLVRYGCCGAEGELTDSTLRSRIIYESRYCPTCLAKVRQTIVKQNKAIKKRKEIVRAVVETPDFQARITTDAAIERVAGPTSQAARERAKAITSGLSVDQKRALLAKLRARSVVA